MVAGTYLSLRRRRVRVAACRPRGRALEPHTAPLARPRCRTPRARAAAAAHTLGPARGRRGLLNPDRTTAPGRGAQGGPSGSARGRGGRLSPSHGRGPAAQLRPGERPGLPPPPTAARRPSRPLAQWPRPGRAPLSPPPPATRGPARARASTPSGSGCARASGSRRRLPAARRRAQGHLPLVRSTTGPPSHPGYDPTGTHQAGTRGPDPGHSPGEGPLIRRACV